MSQIEVQSVESYFKWVLTDVSKCNKDVKSEESIILHHNGNIRYNLIFIPYDKERTHMSLFLNISSSNYVHITGRFVAQELNKKKCYTLNEVKEEYGQFNRGWDKFFDRKDISSLKNDTLTIECYLSLKPCHSNDCVEYNSYDINKQKLSDLNNLFSNGSFSDVTLKTNDGTEFPVHKCILAMQSSVFSAMFQHDMVEKVNNTVIINDIESNVLKAMLEFLYSNMFDKTNLVIDELLIASNKYDIKNLKTICEVELSKKLTVDNVVNYLRLSDLHESTLLKTSALDFISHNLCEILKNNFFKTLETEQPSLITDVLQFISDNKSISNRGSFGIFRVR